jgi:hypothetical protein
MQWRGWYDFGCGALGDMACHVLGAPNMALMLSERAPTTVECTMQTTKSPYSFPMKSIIRFDFPAYKTFPALKLFWHDGVPGGLPAEFWPAEIPEADRREPRPVRPGAPAGGRAGAPGAAGAAGRGPGGGGARPPVDPYTAALAARMAPYNTPANSGVLFKGSKGCLATGEYGGNPRLLPASRMEGYQPPPQLLVRHPETYMDWVRACKGGEPSASDFKVAAPFTEWIDMACLSLRVEGKLEWDSAKMTITNNKAANELLKPTFRKGWSWT